MIKAYSRVTPPTLPHGPSLFTERLLYTRHSCVVLPNLYMMKSLLSHLHLTEEEMETQKN